jgi:hypothetical protein
MRRVLAVALAALVVATIAGETRAPEATTARAAAAQYVGPTISEIEATFDEADRSTRYAVEVNYAKEDGEPLFTWGLTPPKDDPACSLLRLAEQRGTIRDGGGGRLIARSTATWHHGDECTHKGFQHYGWVDVLVSVHHKEKYGEFNLQCSAQYFGTLSGSGQSGDRQEATCDKSVPPQKKIPGKVPIDFKYNAQLEVAYHADLIDTYTVEGVVFTLCAVAPIPATQIACGIAGGISAGLVYILTKEKEAWEKILKDPPDRNFRVVAKPVPVKIPPLGPEDGLTPATAQAFNALAKASARTLSLDEALMTAINRQLGANRAHDKKAQRMQERAAARYARQLTAALKGLAPLRANLRAAIAAEAVDLTVTPKDFADAQQQLSASVFPERMATTLKKLGMTEAEIAQLKQRVQQRRPPGHALVFPAMIDNPGLARVEGASAAALLRYARLLK